MLGHQRLLLRCSERGRLSCEMRRHLHLGREWIDASALWLHKAILRTDERISSYLWHHTGGHGMKAEPVWLCLEARKPRIGRVEWRRLRLFKSLEKVLQCFFTRRGILRLRLLRLFLWFWGCIFRAFCFALTRAFMLAKVRFVQIFLECFCQRDWSMLQVGDALAQLARVSLGRIQEGHEIFGLEAEATVNLQGPCSILFRHLKVMFWGQGQTHVPSMLIIPSFMAL